MGTLQSVIRLGLLGALVMGLGACKIVPIDDPDIAVQGFDAATYVDGIWGGDVLPYFETEATPLQDVLPALSGGLVQAGETYGYRPGEGSPWSFVVNGEGEVLEKNTESRAGVIVVALDGMPEPVQVDVQIGPVIRGNAVRDALPFVSFRNFTNQLEFADVGRALTAQAFAGTEAVAAGIEEGQRVRFVGALNMNAASDPILITPVELEVVE